jgi:hypothetical protein
LQIKGPLVPVRRSVKLRNRSLLWEETELKLKSRLREKNSRDLPVGSNPPRSKEEDEVPSSLSSEEEALSSEMSVNRTR